MLRLGPSLCLLYALPLQSAFMLCYGSPRYPSTRGKVKRDDPCAEG